MSKVAGLNSWNDISGSSASLSHCCWGTGVRGKKLSSSEMGKNKLKLTLSKFLPEGPVFLFLGQQQQSPLLADNIQEQYFSLWVDSQLCEVSYTSSSHLSPAYGRKPWPPSYLHMPSWRLCLKKQQIFLPTLCCSFPPISLPLPAEKLPQCLCRVLCIQSSRGSECPVTQNTLEMTGKNNSPSQLNFQAEVAEKQIIKEDSACSWFNIGYDKPTRNRWNEFLLVQNLRLKNRKLHTYTVSGKPSPHQQGVQLCPCSLFFCRRKVCVLISHCVAAPILNKCHPYNKQRWFGTKYK